MLELAYRRRLGERNAFARSWLPLLGSGGVRLQTCPIFVELDRQPEGALRESMAQIASFQQAVRENRDRVVHVRTAGDVGELANGNRLGLLLALEGAEPLGYDVGTADVFFELGLRMASLTWNRRNQFADGVAETGGLSLLGERLIDRLVELGVVIDLAHASPQTFTDVLALTEGAHVLVSHAGCRAITDHPRNLTDEQLLRLAEAGGMFCLMLLPLTVDPAQPTIGRAIDHLEHAVWVMGAERVGLGVDFTRRLGEVLPPLPDLPDALLPPGQKLSSARRPRGARRTIRRWSPSWANGVGTTVA